jgi:hypothetical protein
MSWSIYTSNSKLFSAAETFELEETSALFFNNKLISSPTFGNQEIYMTTFDVKDQSIIADAVMTTLEVEISILYAGTKKEDFAKSIGKLVSNNVAESLLQSLAKNGHFKTDSTSSSVNFRNIESLIVPSRNENINLFVSLIALVGVLVLTSFGILISSTSCCSSKKESEQMKGIKPSGTMETADSSGNSPGKLGARRNVVPDCDSSTYAITPVKRGGTRHLSDTPTSQHSSVTDMISPAESVASRHPLGIMRLATLNRVSFEPDDKKPSMNSMYQIPLHEASDDEESAVNGLTEC